MQPISQMASTNIIQLRPLNVGDILDQTFRVFRKYFLLLLGIIAVISVPMAVVQGFGLWQYTQGLQELGGSRGFGATSPSGVFGSALASSVPLLISTVLTAVAGVFQTGALASAISELYLGRTISIGQAYRGVLRRIGPLLLATLLVGLIFGVFVAIFFGASLAGATLGSAGVIIFCLAIPFSLVFMVVVIAVSVYWLFLSQAIVLEGHSAIEGLRRSWNLVRGSFWRVFGITLLLGLLVSMASFVPTFAVQFGVSLAFPGSLEIQTILNQVVTTVLTILLTPITAIANTLLYYDLRVRKEGFDLELMARQLATALPDASVPA